MLGLLVVAFTLIISVDAVKENAVSWQEATFVATIVLVAMAYMELLERLGRWGHWCFRATLPIGMWIAITNQFWAVTIFIGAATLLLMLFLFEDWGGNARIHHYIKILTGKKLVKAWSHSGLGVLIYSDGSEIITDESLNRWAKKWLV
ncbi:MAG: hypothetical protein EXS48_02180 [Candidatus Staskawiczbacteria bacterium]|nr:hypothetical protein [Candidatus Staskawiczbacteria bacterium]